MRSLKITSKIHKGAQWPCVIEERIAATDKHIAAAEAQLARIDAAIEALDEAYVNALVEPKKPAVQVSKKKKGRGLVQRSTQLYLDGWL